MRPLTTDELIDYIGTHQRGTIDGEVIAALRQLQLANARAEVAEKKVADLKQELTDTQMSAGNQIENYVIATDGLKHQRAKLNAQIEQLQEPVPMILCCPECGEQHIDRVKPDQDWENPPHRTHQCDYCGHHWRPSDRATTGVAKTETLGKTADQGGAIFKTAKYQAALIKQLQEQLNKLVSVVSECDEYLKPNPKNYIGCGSILHQKLVDAIPPTDLVPGGVS